ncbi:MAG: tetratricopeptide repeat protein [Sandaracinaceae bacterium]|nr:tetratricopeptide repeat protein [Sandaracinaceae bacterium]
MKASWDSLVALALGVLLLAPRAAAEPAARSVQEIFEEANRAFFAGNYQKAIEGYEVLLGSGIDDPDVYYNLGVAYLRLKRYGLARLAFERALRLRPLDRESRQAIEHIRTHLLEKAEEGEEFVEDGPSFWSLLFGWLSEDALAITLLVSESFFFITLAALLWISKEKVRLFLGVTLPLSAVVSLLSALALLDREGIWKEGESAIVIDAEVPLREGPREEAQARGRTREGDRVLLLESELDWSRIRLPNGNEGWVKSSSILPIDPSHRKHQ